MMSYGPVLSVWVSRAGRYTSSILKGAKPAELPVEKPANFEFVVNLTAPYVRFQITREVEGLTRAWAEIQPCAQWSCRSRLCSVSRLAIKKQASP